MVMAAVAHMSFAAVRRRQCVADAFRRSTKRQYLFHRKRADLQERIEHITQVPLSLPETGSRAIG